MSTAMLEPFQAEAHDESANQKNELSSHSKTDEEVDVDGSSRSQKSTSDAEESSGSQRSTSPTISSRSVIPNLTTKADRLQLLFGDGNLPKRPISKDTRPVDEELADFYLCREKATSNLPEAPTSTIDRKGIEEIQRADVYDSLEQSSEDNEYLAACSRTAKKKLMESQNKNEHQKKGNGDNNTKPEPQSTSQNMNPRRTTWAGSKPDLRPSEGATKLGTFCPIPSVAKFPYKYIDKENSERVADRFFNGGKFWERTIDVYYIHPPSDISTKPILLMPVSQVEKLIAEIGRSFRCELSLPPYAEESGFCITFFDDGTPQPRFIGTSMSQSSIKEMESRIPPPLIANFDPPHKGKAFDRSFEAFRQKMMLAVESTKRKSKAMKEKKQQLRAQTHLGWYMELKRAQRYLGLREHVIHLPKPEPKLEGDFEDEDEEKKCEEYLLATNQKLNPLDVSKPVPYPFEKSVIFICIDVESNERAHKQITEIGISALDTDDLVNLPPGESGKNWMKKIRSRHFRIVENSHVVNKDFVHGCADKFEFGKSEWISLGNAAKAIDSCFKSPYSAGFTLDLSKPKYLDAQYQDVMETCNENRPSSSEAELFTPTKADGAEARNEEDDANFVEIYVNGNRAATKANGTEDREIHTEVPLSQARKPAVPVLDMPPLIAARKELSQRVQEDPSILDDADLQRTTLYSNGHSKPPTEINIDQFLKEAAPENYPTPNNCLDRTRPLILLGHDIKSDLSYLRELGYDPASMILEGLDTANMYKALKRTSQSPKLGNILVELGLTGWHLHNAGNDARYTMESMIGILIKARRVEDNKNQDPDAIKFKVDIDMQDHDTSQLSEMEAKLTKAAEEAKLKVIEEYDTWASLPGLAPYIPTSNPATNLSIPGVSSPPVGTFKDRRGSPASPRKLIFPIDIYPAHAIDGGEAMPLCSPPPKTQPTYFATGVRKFPPGYMDKEAVEAELTKQVEFDWESGIKINGMPPVETPFQRALRERERREAALALVAPADVDRDRGGEIDGNGVVMPENGDAGHEEMGECVEHGDEEEMVRIGWSGHGNGGAGGETDRDGDVLVGGEKHGLAAETCGDAGVETNGNRDAVMCESHDVEGEAGTNGHEDHDETAPLAA